MCLGVLFMALRLAVLQGPGLVHASSDPVVTLPSGGQVLGTTINGLPTYLGIRYATAGRFEVPKLVTLPSGQVTKAQAYGPVCAQMNLPGEDLIGSEDCLNLNIMTPSAPSSEKRTVMFWIHGGGLQLLGMNGFVLPPTGTTCKGSYGNGKAFYEDMVREGDIVFVSIYYRLGLFGFYTPDDPHAPKNFGIRDQIAALQWVQINIASFGGDPGSVTIFGQSAGGLSVIALYQSPMAVDLFHRGIAQSPGWQTANQFKRPWQDAARSMSATCMRTTHCETVDCLRSLPLKTLFWSCWDWFLLGHDFLSRPGHVFAGYDGEVLSDSVWASSCKREAAPTSRGRPILIGNVAHEWRLFDAIRTLKYDNSAFKVSKVADVFLSEYLPGYATSSLHARECAQRKLQSLYASTEAATCRNCNKSYLQTPDLIELGSDLDFVIGAQINAAEPGGPRYRYMIDMGFGYTPWGTSHDAELIYTTNCIEAVYGTAAIDEDFGRMLREYWYTFAKTGKPTSKTGPAWDPVKEDSGLLGLPLMHLVQGGKSSMSTSARSNNESASLLSSMACRQVELEGTSDGKFCAFKQRPAVSAMADSGSSEVIFA